MVVVDNQVNHESKPLSCLCSWAQNVKAVGHKKYQRNKATVFPVKFKDFP